jgi:hypothetical protein
VIFPQNVHVANARALNGRSCLLFCKKVLKTGVEKVH